MNVFGVDIGGSGIKGAPVDLERGDLAQERHKVLTPHPPQPDAVAAAVKDVVDHFGWSGPVGVTFPGVIADGVTRTAANMQPELGRARRAVPPHRHASACRSPS